MLFILGVVIGAVLGIAAVVLARRSDAAHIVLLESERSAQFRRITELERQLAEARTLVASAKKDQRLRSEREFGQYKILLRRADLALAQARMDLDRLNQVRTAA